MLTGILKVLRLPPQSTFCRFLSSLQLSVAGPDRAGSTEASQYRDSRPEIVLQTLTVKRAVCALRNSAQIWTGRLPNTALTDTEQMFDKS
jgi:hypothetical protein